MAKVKRQYKDIKPEKVLKCFGCNKILQEPKELAIASKKIFCSYECKVINFYNGLDPHENRYHTFK